jgi:hypothetical protein
VFGFVHKYKSVCVESEIKVARKEVNENVGKKRAVCTENTASVALRSVSLKRVTVKQANRSERCVGTRSPRS